MGAARCTVRGKRHSFALHCWKRTLIGIVVLPSAAVIRTGRRTVKLWVWYCVSIPKVLSWIFSGAD